MKKITPVIVCAILIATITSSSYAGSCTKPNLQTIATGKEIYPVAASPEAAMTIHLNAKPLVKELKAKLRAAKINRKVVDYVDDHFTPVSGLNVYPDNGVLVSKFMMNDRSVRIVFDAKGNWMYTIINGGEKDLMKSDRRLVNKHFKDFSITLVQEIRQDDISCYKIFLEKNTMTVIIFVYDGKIIPDSEFIN